MNIVLRGIVGSRAYGLDHHGSDTDRKAVYAAPTRQLLGLGPPPAAITTTKPDVVTFELGRFVQLALSGNPNALELLWLPAGLYETTSVIGYELIGMRQAFLSRDRVRRAYLGCATALMHKLRAGGQGAPGWDKRQRQAKTGRHLARNLHQGLFLYATGQLEVRLDLATVDRCRGLGLRAADGELAPLEKLLGDYERRFAEAASPLPERPDAARVDTWLRDTRVRLLAADERAPERTR